MHATAALEDLALDLHGLLKSMDPVAFRASAEARLRRRLATVQLRASRLAARRHHYRAHQRVVALNRAVCAAAPRGRAQWMALRARLIPLYDELGEVLSEADIEVPAHRPTNLLRSALHAGAAVLVIALIAAWVNTPARMLGITGPLLAMVWATEATRRMFPVWNDLLMRVLGGVAHGHEHRRVNSATWYVTALFVLALVGDPVGAAVGVAVLGLGDPMAGFVGRRWGSIRLRRGRSLQGTSAFVVAGFVAALVVMLGLSALGLLVLPGAVGLVLLALGGGLVGAVAELFAGRIDDNLLVPVAVGVFSAVVLALL